MRKLAHFALATLFLPVLSGVASAQNIPAIDVFGGYSYLSFQLPASTVTSSTSQRLALNGWAFSGSVALFHHFSAEADISGHTLSNCISTTLTCKNFTYLFGPRYSFGDRGGRLNGFVHGLIGEDRLDLPESQNTTATTTDNSVAFAGGGGIDYWFLRHVGVQLGPVDFVYTRHLNQYNAPTQSSYRVSAGVVFRFGGDLSAAGPAPSSEPSSKSKRSSRGQPSSAPAQQVSVPGRGLPIPSLGIGVAPQEFDGAKIVQVVPGGVAEMASLKAGDLIKAVDGKAVRTPMELAAEVSDKTGKVRLSIMRGDWATETVVILGGR